MKRDVFQAIADPTRRAIIALIALHAMTPNAIAEHFDTSRQAVSKHLRILREAGIVDVERDGTRREYFIVPTFRERLKKEGNVLDFGCCSFRFDRLPD